MMASTTELTLSQIQQESLKVLLKLDSLCKKNDWHYFLFYGTLLGAVRHHGFVPWDDDIDIWMPRKDFDSFTEWCEINAEHLKPFKLCNRKNTKNYVYGIPRFSNMQFKYVNTNEKLQSFDIGVFVDIYPMDNWCDTYRKALKLEQKINRYNILYNIYINANKEIKILKKIVKYLIRKFLFCIKGSEWHLHIDNEILQLIKKHTTDSDKYVGDVVWKNPYGFIAERTQLSEFTTAIFCGHEFPIPKNYDEILTSIYGDYMCLPPAEECIPHHNYKMFQGDK